MEDTLAIEHITDPQIAWHLARFIQEVRGIPADPVVLRQNWLDAYNYVTDKGALALNDYARTSDPFSKVGKNQVSVDVASVIAALEDMDNISMTGFSVLDDVAKNDVASHCLDEQNHAKVTKTTEAVKDVGGKAAMVKAEQAQKKKVAADATAVAKSTSTTAVAVVDSKEKNMLILPKPGEGGIVAAQLASKTFVLTGVFPYLPGGAGLSQGKDYAKQFIHSHGGRCVGSVSGKTDYVVVGNAPGHSKVSKAAASGGRTKLVYFNTLVEGIMASDLEGRIAASPVDPAALSYSAGFRGNGLAYRLPPPKIVHELPSTA